MCEIFNQRVVLVYHAGMKLLSGTQHQKHGKFEYRIDHQRHIKTTSLK